MKVGVDIISFFSSFVISYENIIQVTIIQHYFVRNITKYLTLFRTKLSKQWQTVGSWFNIISYEAVQSSYIVLF